MSSPETSQKPCPICKKPSDEKYLPFCSERCSLVDLGNWFSEKYTIPGEEAENEENAIPEINSKPGNQ